MAGRRLWRKRYTELAVKAGTKKIIWFHCASLGEFEMARPVIEELKKNHGEEWFILLSFFSPSGYEIQKNYRHADAVVYLPIDTLYNSKQFVKIFRPTVAVFVKYEIWVNYFNALQKSQARIVLMNAVFRPDHRYFKWHGGIFRKALRQADKIFVQNQASQQLLQNIGIESIVTGDTRYDRVLQIREREKNIKEIEDWVGTSFCIVCGSTWMAEEKVMAETMSKAPADIKWIIAPHDVSRSHIEKIQNLFKEKVVLHSQLANTPDDKDKNVLVIDSIGKLSQAYSLAGSAIVGGGFSGKLHNILEPAVYGIPVLCGPYIQRFQEAVEMENQKTLFTFLDDSELIIYVEWFYFDREARKKVKRLQEEMFERNRGAVKKLVDFIELERPAQNGHSHAGHANETPSSKVAKG